MPKKNIKEPGSDEKYRLLFENNPHPMWIYDLETHYFLAVNDAAVHQYGYSRDEFISMTIKDIRPSEDVPALLNNISKVTTGLDDAGIWRHRKKDGSIIEVKIISHTTIFEGRRAEVVLANDVTRSRQMEEALRQSEERFLKAFENAFIGMALVDLNGGFLQVNQALCNILGYKQEELLAATVSGITHPDDREMEANYKKKMHKGVIQDYQIIKRYIHADGHIVWGQLSVSLVNDSNGKPIYYIGQLEDITSRKLSEKSLIESEKKYRDLFENANDVIFILDSDLNFVDVNKKTLDLFGFSREEMLKMNVFEIIPPEQHPLSRIEFSKVRKKQSYANFEGKAQTKDGRVIDVEVSSSPIIEDGKVTGSRDIIRDISERKRAEEALRIAEEKYRGIFENAVEGIFQTGLDGSVISMNPAFARMLGYESPREFIDKVKDVREIYSQPERRDDLIRLMETNGVVKDFEFKARKKNGRDVWISLNARALRDSNCKLIGFEGTALDITEHKLVERALLQSEEKHRTLIENIQDGVFIIQEGKIQFANEAFAKMGGYTVEEIIGKEFVELVAPEDMEKVVYRYTKSQAGENVPNDYEFSAIHKDGSRRLVNINVGLISYRGKLASMGTLKDITEKRQTEKKLRLFRNLINQSNDAIFVSDPETGRILDANEKACNNLGYTLEELLNMKVYDFETVIPDNFSWQKHIKEVEKRGYLILEGQHRRKDKTTFPVEINVNIINLGKNSYMVAVIRDITERKQVEKALKKERDLAKQYLDIAGVLMVVLNSEGTVTLINKKGCDILGYKEKEIIGRNWFDVCLHGRTRDEVKNVFDRLMSGDIEDVEYYENTVLTKTGEERILAFHNTIIRDNESRIMGALSSGEDITERKLAEKELRESEERYRRIVETSQEGIWIMDSEGRTRYTNQCMTEMLGYTEEEMFGRPIFEFTDACIEARQCFDKCRKGIKEQHDFKFRRKDGRELWTIISANPVFADGGQFLGVLGMLIDITDRKLAEDELKIKAQLLDIATDSIFVHDLDGNFIYANEASCMSRGYSKDELMRLNIYDIIAQEYKKLFSQRMKDLQEKCDAVYESANIRKDKSIIPVELHSSFFESGGKKLILAVARDITDRKQAEKMQKEKVKAELYGFIISALPVFASGIPSSVRNTMVKNFADRFEKNIKPRFEEEMKRLSYSQTGETSGTAGINEEVDIFTLWLANLFSNFGIRTNITFEKTRVEGIRSQVEFQNCPWTNEAKGNPVFCFICRTIVIRSFTWIKLKGSIDQKASIANGSKTCQFEINI